MHVNPYVKQKIDRYTQLRADIEAMQTRAAERPDGEMTEAELNTVKGHAEEAKAIYNEIAPDIEEQHRQKQVNAMQAQISGAMAEARNGVQAADTVPPLMPSEQQLRAALECFNRGDTAARFTTVPRTVDGQLRAAVTTTAAGATTERLEGPASREPRRLATAIGLTAQRIAWGSDVVFPVWTGGVANVVAEGVAKPENVVPAAVSAVPQTISLWQDVTRQAESLSGFRTRVERALAARVARREDQLLCATAIATTGRQTYVAPAAEPFADSLLHAASLVLGSDVAAAPDVAVVNVADVKKIFGGGVGAGGESPDAQLRLDLHGMTVYPVPTAALAVNKALVGSWRAMARLIVGLEPTLLVDAVSQMKTNVITILLEEAVQLAVDEPTGLVEVTFG